MNVHNGSKFLHEAIDSALTQTYENFEIILWDNHSTDNTREVVKLYSDQRIKYFYSKEFTSLGEARNRAIKKSSGELIAFLDSDDIWMPNKLELQIPMFNNRDVGIVISDTVFFDECRTRRQLFRKKKPPTGMVFRNLITDYFISMETAIIRRSALNSLDHWFDPRFELIEEYDLFIRLSYKWQLEFVDQVLGKWRIHDTSWTWSKHYLFSSERQLFFKKIKSEVPEFTRENYQEEYNAIERSIDWDNARELWSQGERKKARLLLKKHTNKGLKWRVTYLLAWLPYSLFNNISRLLGRISP